MKGAGWLAEGGGMGLPHLWVLIHHGLHLWVLIHHGLHQLGLCHDALHRLLHPGILQHLQHSSHVGLAPLTHTPKPWAQHAGHGAE